ncbi:MAG: glycosyltransferase family 4 protein, partial [Mariprofundaceae bacterium]|nr:glycosyltransferase family 4 protein [Mariprofundaceae bacterium]
MNSIFVSHPGLQHSHQLALALHERGLLQAFWSGVPVISEGEKAPFYLPNSYARKMKYVAIPSEFRCHPMLFQVLFRSGIFLPSYFSRDDFSHRMFHLYDWWISKHIAQIKPKVVVAYENSAYHTFRAAKAIGAQCILDAPSLHHITSAKLMKFEQTPYLAEINRRKDEEVALADLVLTCSPMAAESYVGNGVSANKVQAMLLGADLPQGMRAWQHHNEPLNFIFAGALLHRKAIDIILKAFKRLHDEGLEYRLSFVGGEGEAGWVEQIADTPCATYLGGMTQADMYQQLSLADCLLLPSRYDSFGMVVAEAMACGTPAIVSTQTGAKAMIEQFPQSGWIVEADNGE